MEAYKSQEVTMFMKQMTYMFSLTSHSSTSNLFHMRCRPIKLKMTHASCTS